MLLRQFAKYMSQQYKVKDIKSIPKERLTKSATFSKLAYDDIEIIKQNKHISQPLCFFDGQPEQDAQAYLWQDKRSLIISFRGTSSKKDILSDIDVSMCLIPGNCENARVHNGFMKQFESIYQDIQTELKKIDKQTYDEIIFCGHSLGGALAILASVIIGRELHKDIGDKKCIVCHTYGAPRVGNKSFTSLHEKYVDEHWRIHCEQDPVPMIPFSFRFIHPPRGGLCLPDIDSPSFCERDIPWWLRIVVHLLYIDWLRPIQDHNCEGYINRISNICEEK